MKERYKVKGVTLSLFSKEEVAKLSVTTINQDAVYKENGDPVTGGINDINMGTMDRERICGKCLGSQVTCPGHFGMIKLEFPVYHGNMLDYIRKVLRMVCFGCSHLMCDLEGNAEQPVQQNDNMDGFGQDPALSKELNAVTKDFKEAQRHTNPKSRFNAVFKLASKLKECPNCKRTNHIYKKSPLRIDYEVRDDRELEQGNDPKRKLWPEHAYQIMNKISEEHLKAMGLNKERSNPANMIIHNLAVAPPPVRPSVQMSNTPRSEDDLTVAYKMIIKQNNEIARTKAHSIATTNNNLRDQLQFFVATVMDNDIQGAGTQKHKSGKPIKSIRARLKGKEGRLRGNLMGKRVDFSARSVITPDPALRLDQLGVPKAIATNMTVPEVVTVHNQNYLRTLVDRGSNEWPGAKYIIRTDNRMVDLSNFPNRTDQHLEPGYIVERHLQDDDMVIFNRQPSLHKMSLMGHRIKVLEYSTFRLNLSVTTPYNADFDGDEMNMHVPQSLETKAEVKEIMHVPKQIVAPQSNKPCMGIVQDSLLGIQRMTQREVFLTKDLVMNLLMHIDYDIDQPLPIPAIIKPKPLWTGKQIISLIMPTALNKEEGNDFCSREDKTLIIQRGELFAGFLNGKYVKNSANGLIHIIWKDLGPQACCDFLSEAQYIVNNWLVTTSFTIGVQDIVPKPEITMQVKDMINKAERASRKTIHITQNGKLQMQPGKGTMESFEHRINMKLNQARTDAGRIALDDLPRSNRLVNMVNAGSKGSDNNISQIMACVGQQNVEGKRIPFGFDSRSLPHFTKFDYGAKAKGFVSNSYLTGLTPSEMYFHAMGGREGLIDTACKTAETGYIQRRLIKALEDVMVKYDGTVRTSKEVVIQFLYGEDGMAGEHFENVAIDHYRFDNEKMKDKCNFIKELQQGEAQLAQVLQRSVGQAKAQEIAGDNEVHDHFRKEYEQLVNDRDFLRDQDMKIKLEIGGNGMNLHMPVNIPRIIKNIKTRNKITDNSISDLDPIHYFEKMQWLQDKLCTLPQARLMVENGRDQGDLIRTAHENSLQLFKIYLRRLLCSKKIIQEDRLNTASFDQLITDIDELFQAAIVNPGEMVGSIGAQSMGEPATQMTLNTFHSAGISSKNVTLGVPRLKEVINVAKTIKTPSLKIIIDEEFRKDKRAVHRIGELICYKNLSHLVCSSGIYYDPDLQNTIIPEDQELLDFTREMNEMEGIVDDKNPVSWVLRFKIDPEKALFDNEFEFENSVGKRITDEYNRFEKTTEVIYSRGLMTPQVIRIRPLDIEDEDDYTIPMVLRDMSNSILTSITLRGFPEITKVHMTSSADECKFTTFDKQTGKMVEDNKDNYMIETDGCALQKVFGVPGVDASKTTSNSIYEVLSVLGIEAVRLCLISELRMILGTYGIYVNYRHLATLCDVMTQRGILTSITRHGINRVNSGPLRKCSFEETTEILLEAAFFGEHDPLSGITENIIFGQLCPYGTGSFDLVIDRDALKECPVVANIGNQIETPYTESLYVPTYEDPIINGIHGGDFPGGGETNYNPMTPHAQSPWGGGDENDAFTPMGGGFETPGYGGMNMTPTYKDRFEAGKSPTGASFIPGTPNHPSQMQSPSHYGATPGYRPMSPAYPISNSYGPSPGSGANYSPNASVPQNSNYSPTAPGINYGGSSNQYATTPNYGNMMGTPNHHSTPSYGQGFTPQGSIQINSPSHNPVVAAAASPHMSVGSVSGGNSSGGYNQSPIHYGGTAGGPGSFAYNPNSPSYGSSIGGGAMQRPGQTSSSGTSNVAFKPELDFQDVSDSDSGDE